MLTDLKEVEKFFKICRKQGILECSFEGITAKFGDLPSKTVNSSEESDEIPTDALTPEQMMFYAVENVGQE